MSPRPFTSDLSVSRQISAADIASLKALGYDAIVRHRPDGEGSAQPKQADKLPVAEILEHAATAGFDLSAVVQRMT